jgi:hypothetical protein
MCRVWVRGVPPAQQPAPTECAKAVRVRAPNSRVVFGSSKPATARPVLPRPPITGNAILSPEHSSVYAPAHPVPAIPDRVRTAPTTPMHPPQPMGPARVIPPAPQPHGRVAAPRVRMSVPKPPPRHGR